jgi:acetyl esterase/lipase
VAGVARVAGLDLERFVVLGHSSGGHLALWSATRHRLPAGAPGADPALVPDLAVALAGLGELEEFAARGLDAGSATALVGGSPEEVPERYAVASPSRHPRSGIPQLLVHGEAEECSDLNDLARVYEHALRAAGSDVRLVELPATRHFDFVDPESPAWRWTAGELSTRVATSEGRIA